MNSLEQLLAFLAQLLAAKIYFELDCVRDAIMVVVPSPSRYYEIEFFADGHIECQTFGPPSAVAEVALDQISKEVIGDISA